MLNVIWAKSIVKSPRGILAKTNSSINEIPVTISGLRTGIYVMFMITLR